MICYFEVGIRVSHVLRMCFLEFKVPKVAIKVTCLVFLFAQLSASYFYVSKLWPSPSSFGRLRMSGKTMDVVRDKELTQSCKRMIVDEGLGFCANIRLHSKTLYNIQRELNSRRTKWEFHVHLWKWVLFRVYSTLKVKIAMDVGISSFSKH
jgi:hypothetical protein